MENAKIIHFDDYVQEREIQKELEERKQERRLKRKNEKETTFLIIQRVLGILTIILAHVLTKEGHDFPSYCMYIFSVSCFICKDFISIEEED